MGFREDVVTVVFYGQNYDWCINFLFRHFHTITRTRSLKSFLYTRFLQDTVSGFLLAGVGHRTADSTNFLIVKTDTKIQQVEEAFLNFSERDDVGIILINQHIASDIRHVLKDYNQTIPTVLEIPSKEHPYDPEQDYIMQRVNMYLGGGN
jgi:V-type H+-transporting ATPase subunit F